MGRDNGSGENWRVKTSEGKHWKNPNLHLLNLNNTVLKL
jgi:hypothetical protein